MRRFLGGMAALVLSVSAAAAQQACPNYSDLKPGQVVRLTTDRQPLTLLGFVDGATWFTDGVRADGSRTEYVAVQGILGLSDVTIHADGRRESRRFVYDRPAATILADAARGRTEYSFTIVFADGRQSAPVAGVLEFLGAGATRIGACSYAVDRYRRTVRTGATESTGVLEFFPALHLHVQRSGEVRTGDRVTTNATTPQQVTIIAAP